MKTFLLVVSLLALLAAAIWFVVRSFALAGPPMPTELYVAMTLGILFSIVIGCGLMALVFYSSRHGYDEPNRKERGKEKS